MNNYERLDLYPHNITTVKKIIEANEEEIDTVSTIQATGTGKSYVGLAVALEYKDKKTLWVVPANAIKEHIEQIINNNPNLSMELDFPNLEIKTYQSFVNMTREELANIECDFLVIDEIQHLTAPVWGERMSTLVETHPNMIKLGLTAYTTNYRGTIYERDVTNPDTDEIFSDSVVNEYDLYDAIIDGVLPKGIVKSVITEESEIIIEIKEQIEILKNKGDKAYLEYQKIIDDVIRMIHDQDGVKELIQQSVKPDGKYIYFCPVYSEEGKNDMDTIMITMKKYIKEKYPDKKIVFYKTTSADGKKGKHNRDCFYNDVDLDGNDVKDCIRIMFAKNQYNEGVHAPNVDGVFLGRRTKSDIVAFEQIGRGLCVRGDISKRIEEYTKYSLEELLEIANSRKILAEENASKEQIIELLISPIIIDLADNIEFLEELETNLTDRVKEIREQGPGNKRIIKITDTKIDISVINKELLLVLKKVRENLRNRTWDYSYNLLVAYYNKYGNAEVPRGFITKDGITTMEKVESGTVNLHNWCRTQRQNYNKLSEERKRKLEEVYFRIKSYSELEWERKYNLLVAYYNEYGDTEVPPHFVTKDGVTIAKKDEEGAIKLWDWCCNQRRIKLSNDRRKKLEKLCFRFENKRDLEWERKYNALVAYYEKYGDTEVPCGFITKDGINIAEKDAKDAFDLRNWCNKQRVNFDELSETKRKKLQKIKFRLEDKFDLEWERKYNALVAYCEKYGDTEVPYEFITKDGINIVGKAEEGAFDLRIWCDIQRRYKKELSENRKQKLKKLNFRLGDKDELEWERKYNLLVAYYDEYGDTEVPTKFITNDGVNIAKKDEKDAVALGIWCMGQRQHYKKLSEERRKKLELIGFRFSTRKVHNVKIIELCDKYNLDYKKNKFLIKMPYQELYAKIEYLMDNKLSLQIDGEINLIFSMSNANMKIQYGISKEELIAKYYLNKGRGL